MKFISKEHESFYETAQKAYSGDCERLPFMYLMGISEDTRKHINDVWDWQKGHPITENLGDDRWSDWQTSSTKRLCRLAFNLYSGGGILDEDEDKKCYSTPCWLFYDQEYGPYMIEAVKLRFGYKESC